MFNAIRSLKMPRRFGRTLILAILVISMALLAGCISSSRVYNNDKNVVYNGAMYNMANVKQIKSSISGKLSDSNTVDLKGADRKQIEAKIRGMNLGEVSIMDVDGNIIE